VAAKEEAAELAIALCSPQRRIDPDGTRKYTENNGKTAPHKTSGAISSALSADSGIIEADLARIIAAWPSRPDAIRRAMLALIG
jgi:hypothetical protein